MFTFAELTKISNSIARVRVTGIPNVLTFLRELTLPGGTKPVSLFGLATDRQGSRDILSVIYSLLINP